MDIALLNIIISLLLAPLFPGIINRTKAFFAGRKGKPLLQSYYDIFKLLRKGVVYSRTTTPIFWLSPIISVSAMIFALTILPFGYMKGLISFPGDVLLFIYIFAVARFFTVLAALDTGSAFEGMGASREVLFSTFVEPAFLLGIGALAIYSKSLSFNEIYSSINLNNIDGHTASALFLVCVVFVIILLAENSRIPVDDPNTHLELTMVHEVMVLDHSGPDFAFILYAGALKLWIMATLVINILISVKSGFIIYDICIKIFGLFLIAVLIGVIESTFARLKLIRVPHLLIVGSVLSILAIILMVKNV